MVPKRLPLQGQAPVPGATGIGDLANGTSPTALTLKQQSAEPVTVIEPPPAFVVVITTAASGYQVQP